MLMAAAAETKTEYKIDPAIEELRNLTEINHLVNGRNPDGTYPEDLLGGVFDNLVTKVQEDAMSAAVTKSFQPKAEVIADNGEAKRTFIWKGLGRTALSVAESGFSYHTSEAAFARVRIEVQEALRSETELTPGITQSFISPRISGRDAPRDVALAEHLADEDAVRTSSAVTDENGNVIGRRTQSLLVRDMPLSAWVAMLKDPGNLFGKSFEIEDEASALGVMKLFDQLDLSDDRLPEGPVTLVASAMNYIEDEKARASVGDQVGKFREDQDKLRIEAEHAAGKWLKFEVMLAESKLTGVMRPGVRQFVMQLQSEWPADVQALLKKHEIQDGGYSMSDKLASKIEQGWQKIHLGTTAFVVGDKRALKNVDAATADRIQSNIQFIRTLESNNYNPAEIAQLWAQNNREVAVSSVKPGGGCSGTNSFEFYDDDGPGEPDYEVPELVTEQTEQTDEESDKIGKKKKAVCRTEGCPSRPGETMVGGCDVCLKFCQILYDQNKDPEEVYRQNDKESEDSSAWEIFELFAHDAEQEAISNEQLAAEKRLVAEAEQYLAKMSGKLALAEVDYEYAA